MAAFNEFGIGLQYTAVPNPIFKIILLHGRILRGFPFGNDIMPARSAAVDLYRVSLPPRHRATVARWRGGKEALKASTAADRAGIISFPNGRTVEDMTT